MSSEQSINIPQLLVLLVLGFLVFRWYWSSNNATTRPSPTRGSRINPAHVEQLVQMFPQLDRRTIMWELQRNGGNVQTAIERALGGNLQAPPQTFQPPLPQPASNRASTATARPKPTHPDLITRYNLASKLSTSETPATADAATPFEGTSKSKPAWSTDKAVRHALMQKRREEMILAARRKMEEKDKSGKT